MFLTAVIYRVKLACCTALVCAFALLSPPLAEATSWAIDPVRIELSPEQQTAVINIKNGSDLPTSIQIQVVAWSQLSGKDIYTPTRELLVSPPIITIAPNGEQIIRTALRRQVDMTNELAYRINLLELPPQPTAGFMGLQVALRIGLPVFVKPQNVKMAPKMTWSISLMPDNNLRLGLKNEGNAHVQVSDFALYVPGNNQPIASESGSSYVLAEQTREWILKTSSMKLVPGGRLHLIAYTDAGHVDMELVLALP